jgi:hypothetical protein
MSTPDSSPNSLTLANGIKPKVSRGESTRPSRPSSSYKTPVDLDGLSWPCNVVYQLKLTRLAAGTKARLEATEEDKAVRQARLSNAVREILECLGEDPDREGLKGTPERYAQAMLYFTKGYEENMKGMSFLQAVLKETSSMGRYLMKITMKWSSLKISRYSRYVNII